MRDAIPAETQPYPSDHRARNAWIEARRPPRQQGDPRHPHGFFLEEERNASGEKVLVATLLLTNKECPWRCVMCDLWKTALPDAVPVGAIPEQIDYAFAALRCSAGAAFAAARECKLYNGGSFFDPQAIPTADYSAVAQRVARFDRVIVECHPALVGDRCLAFRDRLASGTHGTPALEVAMGLETAHPETLARLNKQMTLDQFSRAADFLRTHKIALRVFVLVQPPFLGEEEGLFWAKRSIEFAFDNGASVVSLILTRAGNGALEALRAQGAFSEGKLATLEAAQDHGVRLQRGRVFADVWDLERFAHCPHCFPARRQRLARVNLEQIVTNPVPCPACGGAPASL